MDLGYQDPTLFAGLINGEEERKSEERKSVLTMTTDTSLNPKHLGGLSLHECPNPQVFQTGLSVAKIVLKLFKHLGQNLLLSIAYFPPQS